MLRTQFWRSIQLVSFKRLTLKPDYEVFSIFLDGRSSNKGSDPDPVLGFVGSAAKFSFRHLFSQNLKQTVNCPVQTLTRADPEQDVNAPQASKMYKSHPDLYISPLTPTFQMQKGRVYCT